MYLAAVAIFQNEAPYLDEWLAFCVSEGVERVLLYDNDSTDHPRGVLQPWIDAGVVELIDWPVRWKDRAQDKAYLDALRRLGGQARWAAFIDIDEYLFSPTGQPVAEVLKQYEAYPGVVVNWQCYGTSGHRFEPAGLTIESYTRRAKTGWARNRRVKTIVDPCFALEPWGPHLFRLEPGEALVTEDFRRVELVRSTKLRRRFRHLVASLPYVPFDPYSVRSTSVRQVSVSNLRINHYATRSEDFLRAKYKGRSTMLQRDRFAHWRYHDRNEVEDPILASHAELVRQIIRQVRAAEAPVRVTEWAIGARQAYAFGPERTIAPAVTAPRMSFLNRLKQSAFALRRDVLALCLAARDRRVPWYAKALAGLIGAYPVWPIDLIPDVVPVLGYLDDLIIVPLGIFLATRLIPTGVMADLRSQAAGM